MKVHFIKMEHLYDLEPGTNEWGWCTVKLPQDALIERRMHLNRKQARELAKKLKYFAEHGYLKEEKT